MSDPGLGEKKGKRQKDTNSATAYYRPITLGGGIGLFHLGISRRWVADWQ